MGRIATAQELQPAASFNRRGGRASGSRAITFTLPNLPPGYSWVHPKSITSLRPGNPDSSSATRVHHLAVGSVVYIWKPITEGFECGCLNGKVCDRTTFKCLCIDVSQQASTPRIIIADWNDLILGNRVFLACHQSFLRQKKLSRIDPHNWTANISIEGPQANLATSESSGSLNSRNSLLSRDDKSQSLGFFQKIFRCCIPW